ncbi:MAG: hypothetical protein IJB59_09360 [Oscillospiraceae bacterium]|nr:hypothetical protein [Oscillospiraceae bacterium]
MGQFTVPNDAQRELCRDCGIDPAGFMVILDNDRVLAMVHLKSRNEVMISKNVRVKHGST